MEIVRGQGADPLTPGDIRLAEEVARLMAERWGTSALRAEKMPGLMNWTFGIDTASDRFIHTQRR